MEKFKKHLNDIIRNNLDYLPEDSLNLVAEQARNLSIEFAEWSRINGWDTLASDKKLWMQYDDMGVQKLKEPITGQQLFNLFLDQKEF